MVPDDDLSGKAGFHYGYVEAIGYRGTESISFGDVPTLCAVVVPQDSGSSEMSAQEGEK